MIFWNNEIYLLPLLTLTYMSEKNKFLKQFESLSPEEQAKVVQVAMQM